MQINEYRPQALAVLRIVSALLFLEHGTQKLFGFPGTGQTVDYVSLMGLAGVLEFVGGIMLIVGFKTRIVAFILSGMMAVAYWMVHAPQSFYPVLNGGDAAILFCFVFLYLVFAGPGSWSVDGKAAR
ncbi:DoxX family protein [Chelativorans sp. SCAU2101]|jgi:Predicted membrane protein|uniref:DoxX family protein n=1 Tax=Chelativorans petroleitrophicus TaxID=2975484 RepID=A0A9X3B0B7_9HYPH|nr:DoxX family protein [Chelativorans petroleitrophicus]MCT8991580.1 DoxX family protein [Chelativorans petroleitrophicus]